MNKLLLLSSLLLSIFCSSQTIETKIDTTNIRIGEAVRLSYSVDFKDGDIIKFQNLSDTLSYHIEILDQQFDTILTGNKKKIVHQLDLTSFEEGEFLIRTIPVEINGKKLKTKSFQIQVSNVDVDINQTNIHPIKPIMPEVYTFKDYWNKYWIYGIAALILVIIAIVLIVLFIRSKSKNLGKSSPKTPYEEVVAKLKFIDAQKYLKKGDQKEYYTQLSYALRKYMGKVYHFSALELLSDEIVQYIATKEDVLDDDKQTLKRFLYDADLAKFAKQHFDEEKNTNYRRWIGEFVERIKPLDLPENETEDQVTGEKYKKWDNN